MKSSVEILKRTLLAVAIVVASALGLFFGALLWDFAPGLLGVIVLMTGASVAAIAYHRRRLRGKSAEIGPIRCDRCGCEGYPIVRMTRAGEYIITCGTCHSASWTRIR